MRRELNSRAVQQSHGPADAYYSRMPDSKPHPLIRCLCGWTPEMICDTWEEIGKVFDQHIKQSLRDNQQEAAKLTKKEK